MTEQLQQAFNRGLTAGVSGTLIIVICLWFIVEMFS